MGERETTRRGFFNTLAGWAAAGAAIALVGCETAPHDGLTASGAPLDPEDDFGMHGPVRLGEKYLKMEPSEAVLTLFAPYGIGEPFERQWALAHVAHGNRDEIIVVTTDLDTGGQAEIVLWATDARMNPVGRTELYDVHFDDGGRGDRETPFHLRKLCERIADIVAENEHTVTLEWKVPTLRNAPPEVQPEPNTPLVPFEQTLHELRELGEMP